MLEVQHKDGRISTLGSCLDHTEFDPSEGITLSFSGKSIKLTSRNLNAEFRPSLQLVAEIVRHRVPWTFEADEMPAMASTREATVFEQVKIG